MFFGNRSEQDAAPSASAGLLHSARTLAATLLGAVETRLRIFSSELEEVGLKAGQVLLLATAAVLCLSLGVALLAMFFVVLFWDTHRLAVLGVLTGLFLGAGGVAAMLLRAKLKAGGNLFAATLGELAKDKERL